MSQEGFKRKLTAILSADVKGYSRLMGADEEKTVRTLTTYREVISTLVIDHNGRVVDSPGDNILAEFASVVDALRCAWDVQQEIKYRNADLSENRRMNFRIGINLGDVIEEKDRIYGDGVNIAARLEALAEEGGICISGTAYDQVKNKLPFKYEYDGEQTVKNIKEPVRVYSVLMNPETAGIVIADNKVRRKPWRMLALLAMIVLIVVAGGFIGLNLYQRHAEKIDSASSDKITFTLPDKPSIAVLPFENLSGDPEQEYFSDGITEDIITGLSKISGLFVIARHSAFTYKGKAIKIAKVGQELGIRHILEGSVRKSNGRVRITAQLVDATTEGHLWAERYDRDLKDIFALQDEVTQKIVSTLAIKLTEDERKRLVRKYTDNMQAYDFYLQGVEYQNRFTKEANIQARQMFERAIDQDPGFAIAYTALGFTYFHDWTFGWSTDTQSLDHAFELAQKTLDLEESLPLGCHLLGKVYLWKKQYEKAITELEKAITLSPNYADHLVGLGYILNFAGRPTESIGLVKKAMRLNPIYPAFYLWELGHAYFLTGRYEKAIETLNRILDRNLDFMPAHLLLAASYSKLEREEEAQAEVAEVEKLSPQVSLVGLRQRLPYKDQEVLERLYDSMRKAGLK
ncbi:MAG: adenylate/guanylate cyclase domain-containing protein [Planctomycetota bacterium]|jgi:adenylate cyclase